MTVLGKTLIHHIYYTGNTGTYISPFWKSIQKLNHIGECSIQYSPGRHTSVRFWKDIWFDNSPLSSRYAQVFNYYLNQDILLSYVFSTQGEGVLFSDILTGMASKN